MSKVSAVLVPVCSALMPRISRKRADSADSPDQLLPQPDHRPICSSHSGTRCLVTCAISVPTNPIRGYTLAKMALTLLVVFAIIILPFLIYYVTSALFFRTANSKAVGKEPPTVPYFVPGIFSAGRFVRHGARKHFAKAL